MTLSLIVLQAPEQRPYLPLRPARDRIAEVAETGDAAIEPGGYVIKGGAAQFWPWQDQEWVWCVCAMRMPSTALFADQRCAARLARELEQ